MVTHSYIKSFLRELSIPVSTARAGNVIGGGDFSTDRIIPDCVRAVLNNKPLIIRNPYSTRPYQHVFDALGMYLLIAEKQYVNCSLSGSYNIGPDIDVTSDTINLVKSFYDILLTQFQYYVRSDDGPHEASFLSLNNGLIKRVFGWKPLIDLDLAIKLRISL